MKKWKVIKIITIVIFILFIVRLIYDAVVCMNMTYPHPALGIDANTWTDQYMLDLPFIMLFWSVPLLINIILFIISLVKLKNRN